MPKLWETITKNFDLYSDIQKETVTKVFSIFESGLQLKDQVS